MWTTLNDHQVIELYTALLNERPVLVLAIESAKKLECGLLNMRCQERLKEINGGAGPGHYCDWCGEVAPFEWVRRW